MKLKNFLFGAILAVELISFLAIPSVVLAEFNLFGFSKEENPQTFSEFQAKNIMKKFSDVLLEKWMWMKSDSYSDPREITTLSFFRQAINYDVWNYLFQDLPIETSIKVGKAIGEIVQLMTSDNSIKLAMEKIEKGSVKMSVDYLKKELFKMEVKTAFGATKVKYDTGTEKIDTNFQYIMVYIPIDDTKGNLITRIYSPYELTPPQTSASYGLAMGVINDLKSGEKIPPFIVEFRGIITNKNFSWYYQWEGEPEIKLYFPDNVPDFGFKSIPWYDKYIINPIKRTVNGMIDSITGFFSWGDIIEYVNLEESNMPNEEAKKEAEDMINGVNDYEKKEVKESKEEIIVYENQIVEEPGKQEEAQKPKEEILEELRQSCSFNINSPKRNVMLINEVAWMGSLNSANDEWIELKNISASEINLKNWSLYDKDKQINVSIEKDLLVPPYGFVILERTDDNSVPFIKADQIYTGTISNSEESLYLFNQNCELEDFVEANSVWPAGNSKERLTMERSKDLTWHDYNGLGYMNIFGTPKQENSIGKEKATVVAEKTSTSSTYSNGGGGGTIISYCSQDNLEEPLISPIIINEVAWMGGESSSSDEWIELKNISSEEINMNGWQLLDKDNQIKIIFNSSDTLSTNSFYLLERTDDSSVPNIQADKIYSGALSDSDESLRLFNQNCQLIDEIIINESWPSGDSDLKKTMERDSQGWHTFSVLEADTVSGLWGTPKKENSEKIEEEAQENNNEENQEESLNTPSSILITEISLGKEDNNEYVEIFNQTENEVNLCSAEDNCYYLSYFANTFNEESVANHSWDDPSYNWKFPDNLIIAPNSYVLIDIFGNSGGDFKVGEYSSQKLNNSSGALSLFFNNPIYTGDEEKTKEEKIIYAQQLKIDTVAWNKEDNEPEVREGSAFIVNQGNILGRKYYLGEYIDSNNNANDIEEQKQSIKINPSYPPEAINDLFIAQGDKKNSVILSWTSPLDEDTEKEELDYEIYYSLNKEIDVNNLVNISDYAEIEIIKDENSISVLINDLYYDANYYFTVKAKDKELNYSSVSNIVNHSISVAEHIKSSRYIDSGKRNKSFLAGPTNENFIEKTVFIKGKDFTEINDEFSLPLIDENENLYISGRLDGNSGVYAFNKEGNEKWHYFCQTGENFLLGPDGTIYLFCGEKLTALSPSGKLKWQEDIFNFTGELIMGPNGNIYIVSNLDNSYLNIIEDDKNVAVLKRIDLGKRYESFSNIVIDSDNNLYFFTENKLLKFNGSSKVEERLIDPIYDEGYEGEKDKAVRVNELGLSQNGVLIFNSYNAKWNADGRGHSVLCGLSKGSISSEFLWTKEDMNYSLIGINSDEFYVQADPSGDYGWYNLYLYGINSLTGEINWGKHWASNGSPVSKASFILSDVNNNIYFIRGGELVGFNTKEITDNDPLNDKILSISEIGYSSNSISLGKNVIYFTDGRTIKKISF